MFTRDSFTTEEWARIIAAPTKVSALVVTADMSGPIGLVGEFRAMMGGIREFVDSNAGSSDLMNALKDYLATKPSEEEEAQLKSWAKENEAEMKANKPSSIEDMTEQIHASVDETLAMLQGKGASETDITIYKAMMVSVAEKTAEASKEGGFLGFGGVRVSDAEESILETIREELAQ